MNRNELLDRLGMELTSWHDDESQYYIHYNLRDSEHDRLVVSKDEWLSRRTELINCPPDSEAPYNAKARAQDRDGTWHWFSEKPSYHDANLWLCDNGDVDITPSRQGKIPAGHDWTTTLTEVKTMTTTAHEDQFQAEPAKREFNPEKSSLTDSQAREQAVEFKSCSDGKPCGTPPRLGDDAYCAECPNQQTAEKQAESRISDAKLQECIDTFKGLCKEVERESPLMLDTGAHYRHEYHARITDDDIARGYVIVKLDPYRVCDIYAMDGGPREHATKKLLRGTSKGDTERQLIKQVRDALDRWDEMLDEDGVQ